MKKTCSIIGHRQIDKFPNLLDEIEHIFKNLINDGVSTFLFGSKSFFDNICLAVVELLKKDYNFLKRVYVRALSEYISDDYKDYLLQIYDDTYYPDKARNAGRNSYIKRNEEMIDKSDICFFYYNENYVVPSIGKRVGNIKSGTKIAYEYALAKRKTIINIYEILNKKEN